MLLLVDAKLVLLQPTTNDEGELKYDMRVVAHNVEYYFLARDSPDAFGASIKDCSTNELDRVHGHADGAEDSLQDSLWLFDGQDMRTWTDVQALLESAPTEYSREFPASIATTVDFYPLAVLVHRGIVFGVEPELIWGREDSFALFRLVARVSLQQSGVRIMSFTKFNRRRAFSSQTYYVISSYSTTLRQPYTYLTDTRSYPTLCMRSKSSCTMCSTRK